MAFPIRQRAFLANKGCGTKIAFQFPSRSFCKILNTCLRHTAPPLPNSGEISPKNTTKQSDSQQFKSSNKCLNQKKLIINYSLLS